MSVPAPTTILSNQAIVASAQAIAIHSITERVVPGGIKNEQGSGISIGTAYLEIPHAIRKGNAASEPISYEPLTKRYYPDPCNEILNKSSTTVKDFRASVGIDLTPRFI